MDSKLEEITRKIYEEGVAKAKMEAEQLLVKAEAEAGKIIGKAKEDAGELVRKAEAASVSLKNKAESEIRMAGTQAVSLLKQEITGLLSGAVLDREVRTAFDDPEFTKKLMGEMLSKGDFSGEEIDLNITLPERFRDDLSNYFSTRVRNVLTSGVEISFQSRMNGGFKIGPKDKSFTLSFTDKDFLDYFRSFFKPMAKEILFPGDRK